MSSTVQPATSTATSALQDQCISAALNVEAMTDLDNGQQALLLSTDANHGDLQVATADQAITAIAALRAKADQQEALVNEYAAKVAIPALLDEHGIELEELDPASLFEANPKLAAGFHAFIAHHTDGRTLVVVPTGQTPTARLAAIRSLVLHTQKEAQA